MKILSNLFFLPIAVLLFIATPSCKKYEEGPRFSLKSKKERVANKWIIDKAYSNGQEMTGSDIDEYKTQFGILELTKDGDVISTSAIGINRGTWEFSNSKKNLEITLTIDYNGIPYTYIQTYKILRLKEDELWVEFYDALNGDTKIVHFIPA